MGSEDKKIKPKIVSKCSKYIIAVCFLYMICSVAPVSGFFLKSCRISYSTAICVQNEFKKVPQDIPPTVTGFNLSKNQISRIHETDFIHLPVLTKLDLFRNNISQIDSFAFAHLISLQWLNLNHNNLVTLEENVFDGLSNLTQLLITYNHIKVVSFTAFQSLLNLKVLDISNNKLHKTTDLHLMLQHLPQLKQLVIKANDFTHFRSWELTNHSMELCVLDLSFNLLKDFRITTDIFPNLTDFTISSPFRNPPIKWDVQSKTFLSRVSSLDVSGLHVSRNDMKVLLETVNSSITSLKMNRMKLNLSILINVSCTIPTMSMLQVQYNKLEFISSDLFKLCVNVTQLDLAKNNIHTIQERAFTSLVNLRTLSLTSNNLLSVPLATGELRNLSKLDLSFNKIRAVGCQDFSNHVELIELNLQHNSISALKDCAFKDLVQLQVLRLQSNQLTSLNGAFKNPLPNLKQLRLNGNKLVSISKGEFTGLKSLLNLSLHDNQIGGLHADSFVGLINLIEMQLKSNRITRQDLDTGAFNVLMNLRRLDLSINHIKYTNSTVLTQPPFSKLSLLEDLAIPAQHYRKTAFLPPNLLLGLTNLVRFSARNIWLVYMDKDTFKDTPKLKTLDINSNDLVSLSPQLFFPIQNLKSLYISRTSLRSLDFLTEANLSKLEFLQAAYNQFPIITEDVIMSLPSLLYVDFRHNSFSCDCDNSWFLNWTKNSAQTQVSGAFNFSCNYPDDFKGTKLLDFDLTSCLLDTGFICFVSTTCMIFCFMITSFIYHFMGWQLYCAYYLFLAWLYDKKQENKQAPHQYDAFISYNTHDEPWVIGELLPKLEGEQGWRLCLHHRDFEPGKPIIDNITDAIYGSRKTICVISRRYLESEWCSREVQTASFRLFDEQKDVLILLFLEDIPTYLLSPYHRMRKMLKKKTYLSWTRAAEHPDVFWEKLRQALQTGEDFNQGSFSVNVLQAQ